MAVAVPVTLALTLACQHAHGLHAEPRDALRAHLRHRHPGRRRHRGGGEHPPPLPAGLDGAAARPPSTPPTRWATRPSWPPSRSSHRSCRSPSWAGSWGRTCGPSRSTRRAAMFFSLLVAFVVTPWVTLRVLGGHGHAHGPSVGRSGRPRPRSRAAHRAHLHRGSCGRSSRSRAGAPWRSAGRGAVARGLGGPDVRARRAREDASLRQQERVPGDRRHARGHRPWSRRPPRRPRGARRCAAHAARGDRHAGVRGDLGPDQLQRAGAALLPAPGAQRGRHPGEPGRQARPQAAEPRHRQAGAPAAAAHRRALRRATSRWPRCRPARRCSRPWWPRSTAPTRSGSWRSRPR